MPSNKRHHYVPQMYLRYFSKDGLNLRVFSIKEKKMVTESAPIDRQCYEDYFYSKDVKYEKTFSDIEGAAKPIIENIINYNSIPRKRHFDKSTNIHEYGRLLLFVLLQYSRTLFSVNNLNETANGVTKNILNQYVKSDKTKNISPDDLEKYKFSIDNAALLSIQNAMNGLVFLSDLECKLIINQTKTEFITSDNPVILYNKYYNKELFNDLISYSGLACKGISVIFPLTPKYCLIYFDSIMYKIGSKRLHDNVIITDEHDVNELNFLQIINANKTIYSLNMKENYLIKLVVSSIKFRNNYKTKVSTGDFIENKDGTRSKMIVTANATIQYDTTANFLKIRKNIPVSYLRKDINVRDPFLASIHENFNILVKEGKYKSYEIDKYFMDLTRKSTSTD